MIRAWLKLAVILTVIGCLLWAAWTGEPKCYDPLTDQQTECGGW